MSPSPFSFPEEALTVQTKKWDTIMIPSVSCLPTPWALHLRTVSPTCYCQAYQQCNARRRWTIAVGNPSTVSELSLQPGLGPAGDSLDDFK
jgi:hypothetical protein